MPKFAVNEAVPVSDVPEYVRRGRVSAFAGVWKQLSELQEGSALPVTFETLKDASKGIGAVLKLGESQKRKVSLSRSPDQLTVYFWLVAVDGEKEGAA